MEIKDKRTRILEAAERLFSELGYEGSSTRLIARESGANMAMINYYFGSKEGVFMEIINKRISDLKEQLERISKGSETGIEKLMKIIDEYAVRTLSNHRFHKMIHRELSLPQRPEMFGNIKKAMAENYQIIENIINEGISEGSIRQVDVRLTILTLVGTISKIAISPGKITHGTSQDLGKPEDRKQLTDRLIAHLRDLITIYLAPQK
ncbi:MULTISPECIES: TetR/AcrR family transcriptional regulator [Pedobacter]|uniref:TetR/AcrR family transcriptional regulator n=1 Tax=Pedobacter TaxID=84567 RepID=UPI00210A7CDF|nr:MULTISPECIES: TetR/AcrR family transcriptional regulator [unclassified Pedobacter]